MQKTVDRTKIRQALAMLGVDRLAVAIHDQSFPSAAGEEIGRGTPYSQGGHRFLKFVSDLGFNAIQFGPQGRTSRENPSPYDSTLFSKNELSISLWALAHDPRWEQLLSAQAVSAIVDGAGRVAGGKRNRTSYQYAWDAQHQALKEAYNRFLEQREELKHLWSTFSAWTREHAWWLSRDALFEALTQENGTDDWRLWKDEDRQLIIDGPGQHAQRQQLIRNKYSREIEFYSFQQFLAHYQHLAFRESATKLGVNLYGDLQIGFSHRDFWALRHLFLPGYLLGAPPSRTNPDGQPWGYPVLNPDLYFEQDAEGQRNLGPALTWFSGRIDKMLLDFDGLRIDHPHGLVCPWIYRSSDDDPMHAVQNGARLFESPRVLEHPELAKFAIAAQDDLNDDPLVPRYADNWVVRLSDQQVQRYATLIGLIRRRMEEAGFTPSDLICEVLSSCPYPLRRVLESFGLGRFRVTQKAQPGNPDDIYRSDRAVASDWIMVGTHDTPPLLLVVEQWSAEQRESWAQYLAKRLEPDAEKREGLAIALSRSVEQLVQAMFADLFVGPAKNISVFFADIFGSTQIYNKPGIVNEENWLLSVPENFEEVFEQRLREGQALNLPRALSMALRARRHELGQPAEVLAQELEQF